MELKPTIASYSGESFAAISRFLTPEVVDTVARVAAGPVGSTALDPHIAEELQEMHVLREEQGVVRLATAVFLADDIARINTVASQMGAELAGQVADAASALQGEHPVTVNFLVGIMGIGQSHGHLLRREGIAVDWSGYGGKYARAKVDFNEVCPAFAALGPDLQNKGVNRGNRYTAVFIGPGGVNYLLRSQPGAYVGHLNTYLTDAFADLLSGRAHDPALWAAAEAAGLAESPVLTAAAIERYLPALRTISEITRTYFLDKLGSLQELLTTTTSGRQGVPPACMMMNLWRYLRRAIAKELYASGIFTDRAPETGQITLFYANSIGDLDALLQ